MKNYNATIEINWRADNVLPVDVDKLMAGLAEYAPAMGTSARGWLEVIVTLPATNLAQATTTALAVVMAKVTTVATSREAIACQVMTEEEADARQGFVTLPSLIGTAEVAEILGVSQQRVRQLVDAGQLQATPVGKSLAFPRYAVDAFAARERHTGRPSRATLDRH